MYSLTFKPDSNTSHDKNTWDDWQLIPDSPPMVPTPEVITNYIDIPGRTKGPIDASSFLGNKVQYKRITGSWNFFREITSINDRMTIYETLRKFFTGKIMKVVLTTDDAAHYFVGRFTVTPPKAAMNPMSLTINFDLEPMRYNLSNNAIDTTWVN